MGPSPGSTRSGAGTNYSQFAVQNGVALDGTLTIKLVRSLVLNSGDCFDIFTSQATHRQFTAVNSAKTFTVNYLSNGVQLVVP